MSKIRDTIFNFIKGDSLMGHISGYISSYMSLLKVELADDVKKEMSKALSEGLVYIVLFLFAGSFLLFFSIGSALYLNMFFDYPYMGYWTVSGFYLLAFVLALTMKKSVQKKIQKRIIKTAEKNAFQQHEPS